MTTAPVRRMTSQRKVILEELRKVTSHPTADAVYDMVRKRLPKVSLGTVYRNLDLLAESGEILRLEHAGGQMRFDGNPAPHYHVRCEVCGCVGDVEASLPDNLWNAPDWETLQQCNAHGFTITGACLEFSGLCHGCRQRVQS